MMKQNLYILLIIFFILFFSNLNSQELPKSFLDSTLSLKPINKIETIVTDVPNVDSILIINDSLYEAGINHPDFYGFAYNFNIGINYNGTWDTLINGNRIWRYHIICPGAKTINILLDSVLIGSNSNISFYNEDNESLLGPYNNRINTSSKIFSSHLIEGQSVFIELFEPKEDLGINELNIRKVVYGFIENSYIQQSITKKPTIQSAPCHIDANCVEGNDFCREKYSVAIILAPSYDQYWGHCTGSLINNTENDYTPYLLTAFHCLDADLNYSLSLAEKNNVNSWSFKFGYLREGCNWGSPIQTKEYSGADFRAGWNPSDFALVELQTKPISGENNFPDVYFNGWDRTGNIPISTSCLHHPDRDYMKISIDQDPPINMTWFSGYPNNHFRVDFDYGTVQYGSSGASLFDENHRVIGQLHGYYNYYYGMDFCLVRKADYGKFSFSWDGGGTSDTRLKDWLDPNNKGVTTLDGIKMPFLKYGINHIAPGTYNYNAYSNCQIGGGLYSSFQLQANATMNIKAGREIKISPCTYIRLGSEFRAYIEDPNCSDIIYLSDKYSEFNPNVCSAYPKLVNENNEVENRKNIVSSITISPNPVTSISDISLTVGSADNVSLSLYDNLGNQRISYLSNIGLKSGTYHYNLDGNELNSGMFILVLKIDNKIITEKIINLK